MANSQLRQLEQGTAPLAVRMAIAEGLIPLAGDELVEALGILTRDPEPRVREALKSTLSEMPKGFLVTTASLNSVSPDLLYLMAQMQIKEDQVIQPLILNRLADDRTLVFVAEFGSQSILEILAQNRNRMLEHPRILKKLLENEQLSRVTRFALEEFRERFHVDITEMDENEDDHASEVRPVSVAEALPEQDVDADQIPVDVENLQTAPLGSQDVDTVTDELFPVIDEEIAALIEEDLSEVAEERGADADSEDFEESGIAIEDDFAVEENLESVKGFSDGWDIDALVKEVGGVSTSTDQADSFGFDDLLEITLEEDDAEAAAADEWMGKDVAEFARDQGLNLDDSDEDEVKEEKITDTRIRMMKMSAADKLLLAKMGTKQERSILVTDPNKKVAVAVVEGPKMSEFEIQMIAANRQVYEEVLRAIAQHRKWGKSPSVRRELVLNPKTPLDMTVRMLSGLNDFILKDVMKSKEIPSALALQAKRVLEIRERRRGGG